MVKIENDHARIPILATFDSTSGIKEYDIQDFIEKIQLILRLYNHFEDKCCEEFDDDCDCELIENTLNEIHGEYLAIISELQTLLDNRNSLYLTAEESLTYRQWVRLLECRAKNKIRGVAGVKRGEILPTIFEVYTDENRSLDFLEKVSASDRYMQTLFEMISFENEKK